MFAKDNLNFYSQLCYKIMIIIPKLYQKNLKIAVRSFC
jgi:hypothetical protein